MGVESFGLTREIRLPRIVSKKVSVQLGGEFLTMRIVLALFSLLLVVGCGGGEDGLIVFHAGSLSRPFTDVEAAFEKRHPGVDVLREATGSRVAAKKVSELRRRCDVVAVADYTVIEQLLMPKFCGWLIKFATNEMVVAYTEKSKYSAEVNSTNWYRILLREGVEWGHSNPDADPCGYRALLVLQLAEKYYAVEGLYERLISARKSKNIREKETELVPLLSSGNMDYALIYRSMAVQHGLKFINLPSEIDLSSPEHSEFYSRASVVLSDGVVKRGEPIVYAVTIPNDAPNRKLAVRFLRFLLRESSAIFERSGQMLLDPPLLAGDSEKIPPELSELLRTKRR